MWNLMPTLNYLYSSFEVFMEAIDFFYGREEDKYLRLYLDFVVKVLEDSTDHKFMHLDSLLQHFVVALDAF